MSTRQYARLVDEWVTAIGLRAQEYGTHSLRHTKASVIYKAIAQLAWFSNTPHIDQRARFRPQRCAVQEESHEDVRANASATYWTYMQDIDALLGDNH